MMAYVRTVSLLLLSAALWGCAASKEEVYSKQLLALLYHGQEALNHRDLPAEMAKTESTQNGKLDSALYRQKLKEKRASVPLMHVTYEIIDPVYYKSHGQLYARFLARKVLTIDGSALTAGNWKTIRNAYDSGNQGMGISVDEKTQQVYITQLENHVAVLRASGWDLNAARIVP